MSVNFVATFNESNESFNAGFDSVIQTPAEWGSIIGDISDQEDLQEELDAKANASSVYTKVEVDTSLGLKADKATTYTKTETDSAISSHHDSTKADVSTTYTKTEVDTALAGKQATLVSGTNIKTVNSQSILGSGNIEIVGGVTSVNGQTGDVELDAEDVGALPDTTVIPTKTSELTNDSGFLTEHQSLDNYDTKAEVNTKISTATNDMATKTWVEDKGYGTYSKPSGGIPSTDMTSEVQTSLGKADTALQEHQSLSAYRTASAQDTIDTAMQSDIDTIEGKIPAQATSSNQLADKDFVNSSIATETAHYISNNGQPFNSVAELEAYTGTVTNNDYAFVTGTDEQGNSYYDRYKASVSGSTITWAKEYRLNNSSFTAQQWASISSGITASKVTGYDTHVADANIHVTSQNKSDWNAKYDKPSSGIPSTDMTSDVQTSLGKADTAIQSHQDISGKQDTLVSGTNIKTINNSSILGSGDIDTKELFWCTYGTTTYAQISSALSNGLLPVCKNNSVIYIYCGKDLDTDDYMFVCSDPGWLSLRRLSCGTNNTWSYANSVLQPRLYSGANISISNNVISASVPNTYRTASAQDAIDAGKVAVAQGVAKSGQFLVVGSDGNVTTQTLQIYDGSVS